MSDMATVRGQLRRESLTHLVGTDTLPIVSPVPLLTYRVDVEGLTPEQINELVTAYGIRIPAEDFTIGVK